MSISFSIAAPATVSDEELARIRAAGFSAVDLPANAAGISDRIAAAGLKIACAVTSLPIEAETEILAAIAAAAKISAPLLRILPARLNKGEGIFAGIARLGPRLHELAAAAAEKNVTLAVQNAGAFVSAHHLWQLIEGSEHDSVAACLDVPTSTLSGESPVLTIPTLNTRLAHIRVWDYKDSKPAALGLGDARIKLAVERLRGVGFSRAISYAPPAGVDFSDDSAIKSAAHELQLWAGLIKPEPAAPATAAAAKGAAH